MNKPVYECGTTTMYRKGCPCELCKAANATRSRKFNAKKYGKPTGLSHAERRIRREAKEAARLARGDKRGSKCIDWSPYVTMFGVVSDGKIAKMVGVTRPTVNYQRKRRGIPAVSV